MTTDFKVVDEFMVKDTKVLVLDNEIDLREENKYIQVDDQKIPYSLTHNLQWILVNTNAVLRGKEIRFTN